jgi:integrase
VIGKGNTERHVPLPQPVLDDLRKMWKSHHNPKWVFPNRDGTRSVDRGVLLRTSHRSCRMPASRALRPRTPCATAMRPG